MREEWTFGMEMADGEKKGGLSPLGAPIFHGFIDFIAVD